MGAPARQVLLAVALVLFSLAAGVWAVGVYADTQDTAQWWPPAGLGLGLLLAMPRRWWRLLIPVLGATFIASNLIGGQEPALSVILGLVDVIEVALVAVLTRRWIGRRLRRMVDLALLFAAMLIGSLLTATLLATAASLLLGSSPFDIAVTIVLSHLTAMLLVAPLALTLPASHTYSRVELAGQAAFLAALLVLIASPFPSIWFSFLPLPVLIWAAFRFGIRVYAVEQAIFALVMLTIFLSGWVPGVELPVLAGSVAIVPQLYLCSIALTGLPVALAMRQREDALQRVTSTDLLFRRSFTESQLPIALLALHQDRLRFVEVNAAAHRLLKASSEELHARRSTTVLTGTDELPAVAKEIVAGRRGGWSGRIGVADQPHLRLDATLSLLQTDEDHATFSLHLIDITEALETHHELIAEKEYSRAVLDASDSMILVLSQDGTVVAANPATEVITGYDEAHLRGRQYWEVLSTPETRDRAQGIKDHEHQEGHTRETVVTCADGSRRTLTYSHARVASGPDGEPYQVLTAIDVTEARAHERMVSLLLRSASSIAFVSTDLAGQVSLVNTGAESMLGLSAEQAQGRELVDFLLPVHPGFGPSAKPGAEVPPTWSDLLAGVSIAGASETRDWIWRSEQGARLTVAMTTSAVIDESGQVLGYLFVGSDVSDARRGQEILVKALRREREVVARLQELDHVKDEFVSTVSHELRTPMSNIIGTAEMLEDGMAGDLSREQLQMVEVISRNGARLQDLANDLLTLAGFQDGSTQLQLTPVDLRVILDHGLQTTTEACADKGLTHTRDLPPSPVLVCADARHLERALLNLVSNAIKFTPAGGTVGLSLRVEEGDDTAIVQVRDSGIGIPAEDLDAVFTRFYRTAIVQEQAIQGTGLGLSVVRTIVEHHEGSVTAESEVGVGSTFTVRLPLAPASKNGHSASVATGSVRVG